MRMLGFKEVVTRNWGRWYMEHWVYRQKPLIIKLSYEKQGDGKFKKAVVTSIDMSENKVPYSMEWVHIDQVERPDPGFRYKDLDFSRVKVIYQTESDGSGIERIWVPPQFGTE